MIKSTAGFECSFGIAVNHLFESKKDGSELNTKKLDKLENDLEKLLKTVSNEGYLKSASPKVQTKHSERVSGAMSHLQFVIEILIALTDQST